jgi:sugar/nucleoside kinase (ribokinase family)
MTVLVVGSTAFDTIETPGGERRDCLGGSAVYFGLSAALFGPVRMVSVVGKDFPKEHVRLLSDRGIDVSGLEVVDGLTFRWHGRYSADMNQRETLDVRLNTFGDFKPKLPQPFRTTPFVFLANGSPATQMSVLDQMEKPRFVVADTMDLWIDTRKSELEELLGRVDGIILNDAEARSLSGLHNLIRAGRKVMELGPKIVIVKKGEHGSFLFSEFFQFALPAYPVETVMDPTGAGDSFAGGFMGFLAEAGTVSIWTIKQAMAYGTVAASIDVEAFGVDALATCTRAQVDRRYQDLVRFISM